MNPLRGASVAVKAILRNKLRSLLTVLGVVIGVGAVIAMVAIGEGAKARVAQTFEDMGTNMLVVRSGTTRTGGVRGGAGSMPTLTWEDLEAIRYEVPGVAAAAPLLSTRAQIIGDGQNWQTSVQGTTPEYFDIRNWPIAHGDRFDAADVETGAKVAVLGATVVENLFGPYGDPIGRIIRVNNVPFEVIGVAASKGQSAFGSDNDDVVFIPSRAFGSRIEGGLQKYINGSIYVSAASADATSSVQEGLTALLRGRHGLRHGAPDDFTVRNLADISEAQQEGARTMTSLLAGIALVSLLVGGIGIMNIMLVSVTERTREIGLRMAVGAKPKDVLAQFLVEAVTLSLAGGLLGVLAGVGAATYLVARFDWPMHISTHIIVLAVGFSALVGVVFGLYPAHRASRLDPITALRHE